MTFVLLGSEPLDTLEAWTRELFGAVPGGGGARPSIRSAGFPFPSGGAPLLCRIPAVKDIHEITVTFTLPPTEARAARVPRPFFLSVTSPMSSLRFFCWNRCKCFWSGPGRLQAH